MTNPGTHKGSVASTVAAMLLVCLVASARLCLAAPVTIASAGTIATATKRSPGVRLVYDGTRWWAFYQKSLTANTLFYAYSADLSSWTESSGALEGRMGEWNSGTLVKVKQEI